ncbi:hypothetical protein C8F01DRAFT_1373401 [Mycena amicta]|nr:hypothetical protein C8F01DRAFT_1373401 [Mycena amicta]
MHPIFSLENIAKLPQSIRHVAQALVTPGSLSEALEPLVNYVASSPPKPLALSVLCILYHILDPSRLPNDLSIANEMTQIRRAWGALLVLTQNPLLEWAVQAGAGMELWVRVWPWYRLFEDQEDTLRRFDVLSSSSYSIPALRTMLIILLSTIVGFCGPLDLIFSPLEALSSLARAWPAVYEMTDEKQIRAMHLITRVISDEQMEKPASIAAIITGVSGSFLDLARLLLVHLKIAGSQLETYDFASAPLHEDADLTAVTFTAPLLFLRIVDDAFTLGSKRFSATHTTLGIALIEGGLVRILCAALEHMCRSDGGILVTPIIHPILDVLDILFVVPPGHRSLPEAISHGLLHSVLKLARRTSLPASPDAHFLSRSVAIFTSVLPNTLIRVSVLNALKHILPELKALASAPAFRASSAFAIWQGFERLLTDRLAILDRYNAGEFPARKMCDNLKCAVIDEEDKFKRCSGCRMAYYCSPSCQETDWRSGGHKKGCSALRFLHTHESQLDLTPEDRDFLRVLMDVDIERNRRDIFLQTVPLILQQPSSEPVTHFHYAPVSSRPVDGTHISVVLVDTVLDLAPLLNDVGVDGIRTLTGAWTYLLGRAKASEGRLMLDVVFFAVGAQGRTWLVPRYLQNPVLPKVRKARAELVGQATSDSWVWGEFLADPGDADIEFH